MDDRTKVLREELSQLLRKATAIKVRLDQADGKIQGVPHYSVIEATAHELGQEVSRMAQAMHMAELVANHSSFARCPSCETRVQLKVKKRQVLSGDGPVELQEPVGECTCCRRSFFPDARNSGL